MPTQSAEERAIRWQKCEVLAGKVARAAMRSKTEKCSHMSEEAILELYLEVTVCSELSAAICGGRGEYLRLDMPEIRAISHDVARLVHMRLHWINPGESRYVGLDKIVSYVNHSEARSDSSSYDRESKVLKALSQLKAQVNWDVKLVGTSYQVRRPAAPQAREKSTKSQ